MITPRPSDAFHKVQLFRLLAEIADHPILSKKLYFKGGTCASMLDYLDRFSVDLDFDLVDQSDIADFREEFHALFEKLDLEIKDESKKVLQFFLRYKTKGNQRNTIKLDILGDLPKSNTYEVRYFTEIDRMLNVQTIDTMFANKLVALTDRFKKNGSIAGRDLYDIHHFFMHGYSYNKMIIEERTGKSVEKYLQELSKFIEKNITQTIVNQDLNPLLPQDVFIKTAKNLKTETLALLKDEISKVKLEK